MNMNLFIGKLKCDIAQEKYGQVEEQVEFLAELQTTMGKSAELCYLRAVLAKRKERNDAKATAFLKESLDIHRTVLKEAPPK